ncbi:GMC family oxidoreductase [Halorientalis pallida]|uniref:GMC family oxidoreductase n=1 Tax=Halorientalis pallida TaxID=2479928 RepID=A0A498KYI5_9EURY|nr:GMC family oxidoreductase [Halorientalis pallida]RXK46938.1 GMC family oxidoreductase [Halorientalis pallida]
MSDAANVVDRTPSERVDVCIVGAGPAGALMADKLAAGGHDVVVLEAGKRFDFESRLRRMKRSIRPAYDDLDVWDMGGPRDDFNSSGEIFYPLNHKRVKGIGGSTLHWGGRVARLPEKDFEMQSRYGLASDWPINYDDLQPYYARAERELGVAGVDDNPFAPPREQPFPMEAFPRSYSDSLFEQACEKLDITTHSVPQARNSEPYQDRSACVGYGTCQPVCPSGAKYSADVHVRKAESEGARVIDQAAVQRLEHDDSGETVTAAVYRTPDGETHRQTARQFVLAAGGIEIPRLLLLSESPSHPDGLANSSGTVGKFFMESPYIHLIGQLDRRTRQNLIGLGTMESHQFYTPEEAEPGSFKIEFGLGAGPTPAQLALEQRTPLEGMLDTMRNPTSVGQWSENARNLGGIEWGDDLLANIREQYGNYFSISAEIEVLPRVENRVTLDRSTTDAYGKPIPDVSWNRDPHAERTIERAFEVLESIVDNLDADVREKHRSVLWNGVGHHSGTTRMGTDPGNSVVDPQLRTHDLTNLYLVSSSVFVTSGAMQPTLTIAALALRAADHLASKL